MMMYLWWSLCTLYLHACQVKLIVGNSGLCYCVCVMSFARYLTPLCHLLHTDWWQKGKETLSKIWTDQHSHVNIRNKKTVLKVLNWPLKRVLKVLNWPLKTALKVLNWPLKTALKVLNWPLKTALKVLNWPWKQHWKFLTDLWKQHWKFLTDLWNSTESS